MLLIVILTLVMGLQSGEAAEAMQLHPCMAGQDADDETETREQKAAERMLVRFLSCLVTNAAGNDGANPCRSFTAQALMELYQDARLGRADGHAGSPVFDLQELIATVRKAGSGWQLLGPASRQEALLEAHRRVEDGQPTLAVLTHQSGVGHIAIILPGSTARSAKWSNRLVPNSMIFRHDAPRESYVGCPLSYAFRSPSQVTLYSFAGQP